MMKAEYDAEVDALYLDLRAGKSEQSIELDKNVIIDVDADGELLGIEVLFAKERHPKLLEQLNIKAVA
ncbi:MAG: DUF2283 domain-containing protein [Candidatus Woesearchaeota archaeon]|jgi:uncharacterized protein YuzE|nr:DUF2283 domain-containing protein [Candidatus Woesearchaeota archaeon]MDP7181059.1 DUF2283 domain-containing protein [Candidatus Woesearchaeota archaeon]MDP7198320.1 DUF2283 domain-containing protein [Candidatus Woesearchaeota archaeon]MDP7467422.1 DUF2283 domain-containing protein [Candidatus Woesearchaeota archaeon]MDP7647649.1 DUF2283 domain-containing protein [Candidatus Woesearchaeota archaeon]|tara:strand:- start:202 stop:405 length:204 start_codon:yes stop_codon:yes gene_type:complete